MSSNYTRILRKYSVTHILKDLGLNNDGIDQLTGELGFHLASGSSRFFPERQIVILSLHSGVSDSELSSETLYHIEIVQHLP